MPPGKTDFLKQALVERLRTGDYAVGSRLPGLRRLAEEFGVHPNTAARVVSDLVHDGVLRTAQGRGTFVVSVPDTDGCASDQLLASARSLAIQARRLGLTRRDWVRLTTEAEAAAYEGEGPSLWFVECSPRDGEELSASLSTLIEDPVRPMMVDELPHHLVAHPGEPGFFITTPFHLEEVEAAVGDTAPVVAVNVVPTSETLVAFARFPSNARVAVVASNTQTLVRFVRMVTTYTRNEPFAAHLVHEPSARTAAQEADILVDSHSIHPTVASWHPAGQVLTVRYHIEPTSLAYLREVLRLREVERSAAVSAA